MQVFNPPVPISRFSAADMDTAVRIDGQQTSYGGVFRLGRTVGVGMAGVQDFFEDATSKVQQQVEDSVKEAISSGLQQGEDYIRDSLGLPPRSGTSSGAVIRMPFGTYTEAQVIAAWKEAYKAKEHKDLDNIEGRLTGIAHSFGWDKPGGGGRTQALEFIAGSESVKAILQRGARGSGDAEKWLDSAGVSDADIAKAQTRYGQLFDRPVTRSEATDFTRKALTSARPGKAPWPYSSIEK